MSLFEMKILPKSIELDELTRKNTIFIVKKLIISSCVISVGRIFTYSVYNVKRINRDKKG